MFEPVHNQSVRRPVGGLYRSAVLLCTLVLGAGCTVRLIGDYDATIDQGVSDLQQRVEVYFAKLRSTPTTPYDPTVYDELNARLAVLKTRASLLAKYSIIASELANLQTQVDTFKQLDQISPRPLSPGIVTPAESSIVVSVESILKLELALKRGDDPPNTAAGGTSIPPASTAAIPASK